MYLTQDLLKKTLLVFVFLLCLTHKSITFGGQGLSANYLYVILALFLIFYNNKIKLPSFDIQISILIFTIIFTSSIFIQIEYVNYLNRKLISFILFLTWFSFCFTNISINMISSFKIAIVLICTYYSAINIYTYFDLELYKVGATAKSYTGSQRYGFVHILALTVVLFSTYNKFLYRFLSVIPFFIIFTGGLLLSFSRSSVISFFICIFIFFIFEFFKFKSNISKIKLLFILFFLILIVYLSSIYFNSAILFFEASIFGKDNLFHDILNPESSAGYRFFMFYKILQHTIDNILTGSGFLGVWIMFEDKIGSAHSQYGDILFRTGFIGTIVFLYLISRVCFFLFKFEKSFFYGFIGILAYGLFHETFKISQGAFIFAFFLGLMNSSGSRYIKF